MAYADVAVQLGPRNTRRLIGAGVVLGVVAAITVLWMLLVPSPNQSGSGSSVGSSRGISHGASGTPILDKITSVSLGTPPQEVRRLLGAPAKVVGKCWQYTINERNYVVHDGKRYDGGMVNAMRLCFGWPGGELTSTRTEDDGKWSDPADRGATIIPTISGP